MSLRVPGGTDAGDGGGVDENKDNNGRAVRDQRASGMPQSHARHHGKDHDGGRACRESVDGGSDRDADVKDRESEKQDTEHQPGISDVEDDQQFLAPCGEASPAAEPPSVSDGGGNQERPSDAMIGEKRPNNQRGGKHADRRRIEPVLAVREDEDFCA